MKAGMGQRVRQYKQSGVPHVNWVDKLDCWKCQWMEAGKNRGKLFSVRRYLGIHGTYERADVAAMQDAIAFRASLVKQGLLKEVSRYRSIVPGVTWNKETARWSAQIQACGESRKAYFYPKSKLVKDVKRARLDAEKQRQDWEHEYGIATPQMVVKASNARLFAKPLAIENGTKLLAIEDGTVEEKRVKKARPSILPIEDGTVEETRVVKATAARVPRGARLFARPASRCSSARHPY